MPVRIMRAAQKGAARGAAAAAPSKPAAVAKRPSKTAQKGEGNIQDQLEGMLKDDAEGEKEEFDTRVDSDAFRGLRLEMASSPVGKTFAAVGHYGDLMVSFAILINALQMGLSIQLKGEPAQLWWVGNHIFTGIFATEMLCKLCAQKWQYFHSAWNVLDFFVTNLSIFSYWILPMSSLELDLGTMSCLRMLRLIRVVRLFRVNRALQSLVEGLLISLQSLGWILTLLLIISYVFGLLISQLIDHNAYDHWPTFDPHYYFGDVIESMLTLFNMCILVEWVEIIRPVWWTQPYLMAVFLPYLMLCTFGVLNLMIGVIAEQTLAKCEAEKEERMAAALREKMKAILLMTDEMYAADSDGVLTKEEFLAIAESHPDFVGLMRKCEFPRGFEIQHLHTIFDASGDGHVEKTEFINGMFHLVFNNISQHATALILSLSQIKRNLDHHHNNVSQEAFNRLERRLDQVDGRMELFLHHVAPVVPPLTPRGDSGSAGVAAKSSPIDENSQPTVDSGACAHHLCQDSRDQHGIVEAKLMPSEETPSFGMQRALQQTQDALGSQLKQLETVLRQSQDELKRELMLALESGNQQVTSLDGQPLSATRQLSHEQPRQDAYGMEFMSLHDQMQELHAAISRDLMSVKQTVAWIAPLAQQGMLQECAPRGNSMHSYAPSQTVRGTSISSYTPSQTTSMGHGPPSSADRLLLRQTV